MLTAIRIFINGIEGKFDRLTRCSASLEVISFGEDEKWGIKGFKGLCLIEKNPSKSK